MQLTLACLLLHFFPFILSTEMKKGGINPSSRRKIKNRKRHISEFFINQSAHPSAGPSGFFWSRRYVYFLRNEQPSVSLALPPVGWQRTVEQPAQTTTVWACEKTVVIVKQPGHLTSMKKERGAGTRVYMGEKKIELVVRPWWTEEKVDGRGGGARGWSAYRHTLSLCLRASA